MIVASVKVITIFSSTGATYSPITADGLEAFWISVEKSILAFCATVPSGIVTFIFSPATPTYRELAFTASAAVLIRALFSSNKATSPTAKASTVV